MPVVLFEMKNILKSDNVEIKLFALEVIVRYRGWYALEGILFAIAKDEGVVSDKAKKLLGVCITRVSNIYSKPDGATSKSIISLCDDIRRKGVLPSNTLKELRFFVDTRI